MGRSGCFAGFIHRIGSVAFEKLQQEVVRRCVTTSASVALIALRRRKCWVGKIACFLHSGLSFLRQTLFKFS